jgi:putative transposase
VARLPRKALVRVDSINHCSWRSHNHEHVLEDDAAKSELRRLLLTYKRKYGIVVLAYCLMGTHPHVVCVATRGQQEFSAFWRVVNNLFARWYNRRHRRCGQVVMERLSSPQIQDERHLIEAIRYGDLNPVRAGLVRRAKDWQWSSHRHYALGEPDELVDDATAFLNLGRTPTERRLAYRHLFARRFKDVLRRRHDLTRGPFIGDDEWCQAQRARAVSLYATGAS